MTAPDTPPVALKACPVIQADRDAADKLDDALGFLTAIERPIIEQALAEHRQRAITSQSAGAQEACATYQPREAEKLADRLLQSIAFKVYTSDDDVIREAAAMLKRATPDAAAMREALEAARADLECRRCHGTGSITAGNGELDECPSCHGDVPAALAKVRGALRALPLASTEAGIGAGEYTLPCDVHLPPATVIKAGCGLSTLKLAMEADYRPRHFDGNPRASLPPAALDEHRAREVFKPVYSSILAQFDNPDSDVPTAHEILIHGKLRMEASEGDPHALYDRAKAVIAAWTDALATSPRDGDDRLRVALAAMPVDADYATADDFRTAINEWWDSTFAALRSDDAEAGRG